MNTLFYICGYGARAPSASAGCLLVVAAPAAVWRWMPACSDGGRWQARSLAGVSNTPREKPVVTFSAAVPSNETLGNLTRFRPTRRGD